MLSKILRKVSQYTSFPGSANYWDKRYSEGGTSGPGSFGPLAQFKSNFLNTFVDENNVRSVIEFGSGDGNQLSLANYPSYMGVDVSPTAIETCRTRFSNDLSKRFLTLDQYASETAELSLSIEVIFHIIENDAYHAHMTTLFRAAERFVIVYSSNFANRWVIRPRHVRHRRFTDWTRRYAPDWTLSNRVVNPFPYDKRTGSGSFSDFFVFTPK